MKLNAAIKTEMITASSRMAILIARVFLLINFNMVLVSFEKHFK